MDIPNEHDDYNSELVTTLANDAHSQVAFVETTYLRQLFYYVESFYIDKIVHIKVNI